MVRLFAREQNGILTSISFFLASCGMTGCLSVPFEVAGSVIEATGDVVETAVEAPVDVVTSIGHIPSHFQSQFSRSYDWNLDCEGIQRVQLTLDNGSVHVVGADQESITIHACVEVCARTESAARDYINSICPQLETNNDTLCINQRFPSDTRNFRAQIHYEIKAPHALNLDIRTHNAPVDIESIEGVMSMVTHNGDIRLTGCAGDIEAETHNGQVKTLQLALRGPGAMTTHNGSIHAEIVQIDQSLAVESHNGNITVVLPADFQGKLDARNSNGSVQSEFPIRLSFGKRNQVTGVIGERDQPEIIIRCDNGDITVKAKEEPVGILSAR